MVTEWVKWLQNWVKWLQNWVTQKTPNMKNPNATKTLKMLQQNSPNALFLMPRAMLLAVLQLIL